MVQSGQFKVVIPSQSAEGHQIQERIVSLLEELEYPMRDVFGVRLALEEALVNAIKHGNGMDSSKSVHIECEINSERVWIKIQDEGPGFDMGTLPDPTLDENLDKPSGRGILLMREFMTKIEFNEQGNCVVLEKRRGASPSE